MLTHDGPLCTKFTAGWDLCLAGPTGETLSEVDQPYNLRIQGSLLPKRQIWHRER